MNKKKLNKILDDHKLWLSSGGEKGKKANLCSADLSHADLSHADLSYADLSYADLRHADLSHADLSHADLSHADLRYVDLRSADLRYVDLDFSAFPLWCGGLHVHIDDKQATQLLYHLVSNVLHSKNTSEGMKKLCKIKEIVKQANKFHRVDECGRILEEDPEKEREK